MGFPLQTISILLGDHKLRPFANPVLTLGRQHINGRYEDLLRLFAVHGFEPQRIPSNLLPGPTGGAVAADVAFFAHLGLECQSLDISDDEGANIIHDLNLPIPEALRGKFGTIIDGGTIEHVFDIRAAFQNIAEMLAPGGRVIHITPCNNYVNHGFWQLSPTSFFDFYEANGFDEREARMIVHPRKDYLSRPWSVFPYDPNKHGGVNSFFSSRDDQLVTVFSARKTENATSDQIPMQLFFRKVRAAQGEKKRLIWGQYTLKYDEGKLIVESVGEEP